MEVLSLGSVRALEHQGLVELGDSPDGASRPALGGKGKSPKVACIINLPSLYGDQAPRAMRSRSPRRTTAWRRRTQNDARDGTVPGAWREWFRHDALPARLRLDCQDETSPWLPERRAEHLRRCWAPATDRFVSGRSSLRSALLQGRTMPAARTTRP